MNFLRQQSKVLFTAVAISFGFIVAYATGLLRPVEHFMSFLAEPVFNLTYTVVDSMSPLYQTTDAVLLSENTNLKDQLVRAVRQNTELQTEIQQYQEYKTQLDFAHDQNYTIVAAKVISRVGQHQTGQIILINQGSAQGVQVGYPIMYGSGVLLGVVSQVRESSAEVILLTDDVSDVQGMVQNDARTTGIVSGQFGTSIQMNYVLKDQPIAVGDMVVTNGQDQFIPAGLVIGTVQAITTPSSELFIQASLTPITRYGNNSIVSVIIPKT